MGSEAPPRRRQTMIEQDRPRVLHIYSCRRGFDGEDPGWSGGLIIAAYTEEEAVTFFKKHPEGREEGPLSISDITPTRPGVIYNDDLR